MRFNIGHFGCNNIWKGSGGAVVLIDFLQHNENNKHLSSVMFSDVVCARNRGSSFTYNNNRGIVNCVPIYQKDTSN